MVDVTARGTIRSSKSPGSLTPSDDDARVQMELAYRAAVALPEEPRLHLRADAPGHCAEEPQTVAALRQRGEVGVPAVYHLKRGEVWRTHGEDEEANWTAEGGATEAHVYGEVTTQGMFDILQTAACVADDSSCDSPRGFQSLAFYDLGSGQGKFPMFAALLGFPSATGVELDQRRYGYAQEALKEFKTAYPCLKDKLSFDKASFVSPDAPWAQGALPRVVFLDAVCFSQYWADIQRLMQGSCERWGKGSTVVVIGQTFRVEESNLELVETKVISTSWSDATEARFYKFASNCKGPGETQPESLNTTERAAKPRPWGHAALAPLSHAHSRYRSRFRDPPPRPRPHWSTWQPPDLKVPLDA